MHKFKHSVNTGFLRTEHITSGGFQINITVVEHKTYKKECLLQYLFILIILFLLYLLMKENKPPMF